MRGHIPLEQQTALQAVWNTKGAFRLFVILLIYMSGVTTMIPNTPNLMTNDFASRLAGKKVHCQDFIDGPPPEYCQNAHSDVVFWSTWSGFFQNTMVAVILTPALGAWSDVHGRKPFILLAQCFATIPLTILLLNITMGLPLWWYYIVSVVTGSINSITPSLAYIADVIPPCHRAACFGLIMACFSVAILIGPAIGSLLAPSTAPVVALATVISCMVATLFWLPESLSEDAALEARERRHHAHSISIDDDNAPANTTWPGLASTRHALSILQRNSLFIRLTVVLMLSAAVMEGLQDLLIQYLQLKVSFDAPDVAHLFMIFGGCALLVQGFLLRGLLGLLGEQRVLVLGLGAYAIQQVALALATSKTTALIAVSIGSIGSVTFPTISSIKANNAEEHEQGSVQGALYGARALASGVGPLIFAWLFSGFSRTDSSWPYYPGAPFFLGAGLMVVAVAVSMRLPVDAGGNCGSLLSVVSSSSIHSSDGGGYIAPKTSTTGNGSRPGMQNHQQYDEDSERQALILTDTDVPRVSSPSADAIHHRSHA